MKRLAFAFVVLAGTGIAVPPAHAVPLYDHARDCIREEGAAEYESTRRRSDPSGYRVLGKGRTLAEARRARDVMVALEIFSAFTPRSRLGPAIDSPYRIFVVPESELGPDYAGLNQSYCSVVATGTRTGVLVLAGMSDIELVQTLIHELFHASGVDRSPGPAATIYAGWFDEAAATWGETKHVIDGDSERGRDDSFIDHPELALDLWDHTGDAGGVTDHEYGAYRFVQHLETYMGEAALYRMIRDVYSRLGDPGPEDHTVALVTELDERGTNLGNELGAFWGTHLQATLGNGPKAPANLTLSVEPDVIAEQDIRVPRLSAKIVNITIPAGVQQLEVTVEPPPAGGYAWWRDNELIHEVSSVGVTQRFCVGGSDEDSRPWPGNRKVRVALTNGQTATDAGELEFGITLDADRPACTGPDDDPIPGDYDSARLPGGCPRPPREYEDADGSHYREFGTRVELVYSDVGKWVYLEAQRARRSFGYLRGSERAKRVVARRVARRYRCGARRLGQIRPVPDDTKIKTQRDRIGKYLRRTADAFLAGGARGDVEENLLRAGKALIKLVTRVAVCNSAIVAERAEDLKCEPEEA